MHAHPGPPKPVRRGRPKCCTTCAQWRSWPAGRSGRGGRRFVRPGGAGVQRRVLRPHRQAGGRQAQSQEPCGLRLRHPCGDSGRRRAGEGGLRCPRLGKVVNPTSIQGQIEGGVLMGLGYALTEDFPLKDCVPQAKFGTLADAGRPDSRHPRHLCGEGGAAPLRLRGQASARSPLSPPLRRSRGPTTPVTTSCAPAAHAGHLLQKASQEGRPLTFRGVRRRPSGVPLSCFSLMFQAHFYGC